MTTATAEQATAFVTGAVLPDQRRRGADPNTSNLQPPAFDASKDQAIVAGSGVVSFKSGVPANRRQAVADSLLLAQLILKHQGISPDDTQNWYRGYGGVLSNLGWRVESCEMTDYVSGEAGLDVHEAITAVAALLLGPGAIAAAPLIDATLKALRSMDTSTPWITLFNRESRRANTASFQIALAEPTEAGDLSVSLMAFSLAASMTITQVLFVKVQNNEANLKRFSTTAQINLSVLDAVQATLQQKVASFTSSYLSALPDLS
ncbi:hypothetical protein [Paraburkholderia diazotrophica]|uniref:Virulence factor Evf domain-containing protein n=1 Tax=Paraburkholderia diazotrophica TaxID=667676 RepID=A0A1H6VG93_9BURK|nr:hypothetical protein [Paraburkholderia diazotrophica]SEJ03679.1 hypothetical protein SAMN05192539_100631 [Paraburkholderia diazotrophica]